ncbi:hypothetical protein JIX56_21185 [Streptomyces sp. CA-210063]|uniref:hypothetical protein n=1 Tax=Streptomyces sp. CA-210063 TaxID=2801029 RepID=UPI00214CED3E|nr:hypothetical protein [Streptomyces sp. CA-210063]UUU32216.1 hypothetical protein JIX56_21185 [Streptomyces sp. CA-210063]
MRIKRALTIGALLLMSTSLTACGDDDKSESSEKAGAGASKGSAEAGAEETSGGLPSASDMASIETFLNQYVGCSDLQPGTEWDNSTQAEKYPSWGEYITDESAWAIKERAVCRDRSGHPNTLVLMSSMKQFQATMKAEGYSGILIGKDFAVKPYDDEATQALKASGLVNLVCDAEVEIPSGYKQEPAEADGCLLTDYFID